MNGNIDIKDLTYPHHVIQLADLYLTKIDNKKDNINFNALIAIHLYSLLKDEITAKINLDELSKNIGTNLRPIVDAIKNLTENHQPSTKDIQEKILTLSNIEDEIIRKDIEDLVILSLFIELLTNKKLGKTIDIIDTKIEKALSSSSNFSDLVRLIRTKLEKRYQYDDNSNIVMQGLLLIYNLDTELDEEKRKNFRLRLFKWIKNVSDIARYIQPESKDILPTSKVIYETYLSAIILTILDYRSSCSLRKGDFQAFLDKLLGYNLYEEEKKKLIEEILTINIKYTKPLPLHKAVTIYTILLGTLVFLLTYFSKEFPSIITIISFIIGLIISFILFLFKELFRNPQYFIRKLYKNKET